MYTCTKNKRTQHNIETLKADGYQFIEPGDGYLACGYVAKGRMEEPLQIVSVINQYFNQHETQIESSFKGKMLLLLQVLQLKSSIQLDLYQIVHQEKWDSQ